MPSPKHPWTDQRVEEIVGNLLRGGVIVAATVVLAGGLVYLVRYGGTTPEYGVFHGEPTDLRSVSGIVTDALELRSRGIIQLGLLLLVATPVARVVFSIYAFAHQRDLTYVIITSTVLAILLYSLASGYL